MKFTVFQINLSDTEYENNAIRELYLDTIMSPDQNAIENAKALYKPVAEIDAVDFNDVFEIGNLGPEEKITRKAPMHSVSVGDVIVREDGMTKYVAPIGFGSVAFI